MLSPLRISEVTEGLQDGEYRIRFRCPVPGNHVQHNPDSYCYKGVYEEVPGEDYKVYNSSNFVIVDMMRGRISPNMFKLRKPKDPSSSLVTIISHAKYQDRDHLLEVTTNIFNRGVPKLRLLTGTLSKVTENGEEKIFSFEVHPTDLEFVRKVGRKYIQTLVRQRMDISL